MNASKTSLNNYKSDIFTESCVLHHRRTYGLVMDFFHWHPHYEILIVPQGNYTICNNGQIVRDTRPIAILHCPYTLHNMNATEDYLYDRFMITFNKAIIQKFTPETLDVTPFQHASLVYAYPNPTEMLELLSYAEKLNTHINEPTMSALLIAIILRRIMMIYEDGRGEILRGSYSYIQDALQYISEHISEPPTAAELAKRYGVGTTKFHADFKATIGTTYKKHLTDMRQTHARSLLEGGTSIINTSIDTGYSSEAHFIKAFREYWGVTPGELIRERQ